jgi:hypothetical protein
VAWLRAVKIASGPTALHSALARRPRPLLGAAGVTFPVADSSSEWKPSLRAAQKGRVSMTAQREEDEAETRQQADKIAEEVQAMKNPDGQRRRI